MKRWFAVTTFLVIFGLIFGAAQVSASSEFTKGEEQSIVLKKTQQPKTNPGLDKQATKEAEREIRQSEKELRKAEKEIEQAEKKTGKKVHFRGVVTEVLESSFTLDIGGTLITFMVDEMTQIKIPTLNGTAELADLNVGVKASVQAVEMTLEEPPEQSEGEGEVQQGEVGAYLALKVLVIPGKPVRIHHVGVVTNYQPGVSITIQAKDMQLYTFLLTETTKILPTEREEELVVGVFVTIISRRDPTGGPLTAQGIVIHPKVDEDITEPADISLSASSVAEGLPNDSLVGTFTTTDANAGDIFTYTLVPGIGDTDNDSFSIVGDALLTTAVFDFETKSSYSIRVRSTDQNGSWFEKVFIITVTDLNEAPTAVLLSASSIAEGLPVDTLVGTFTTIDADIGETFTYTLAAGEGDSDNAAFHIVDDRLYTSVVFDFETKSSYSIRVRSTDLGSLWYEQIFVITVTDVTE